MYFWEYYPSLLDEWDYEINPPKWLLAAVYSKHKAAWICKKSHRWEAVIMSRTHGQNCPYCSGKYATSEVNLSITHPSIAAEWHPTKNGNLTPDKVLAGSKKKVWWLCKANHCWQALYIAELENVPQDVPIARENGFVLITA